MELFSVAATGRRRRSRHRQRARFRAASERCSSTVRTISACRSLRCRRTTVARIDDTLDPGLEAANPLDAWGTGIDADRIFRESFLALHEDPDTAAMAFVVDLTRQGEPYDEGYLQVARDVCERDDEAVLRAVEPRERRRDRGSRPAPRRGDPCARGHLVGVGRAPGADRPPRPSGAPGARCARPRSLTTCVTRWRSAGSTGGGEIGELEGFALLADYGVPVVGARAASTARRGASRRPPSSDSRSCSRPLRPACSTSPTSAA